MLTATLHQLAPASYFVLLFLILTSPVGGVFALAGFFAQRHGQRAGRPVAIRESTLHSALGAAGCAALFLLGATAYHAAYWFRHAQADPPHILAVVATLIAFQLLVMIWVIRATGWRLAAVLWGCARW